MVKAPKCTISVGKETYGGRTISDARQKALDHLARFMDGEGFDPDLAVASIGIGIAYRDETGNWSYQIHYRQDTGTYKLGPRMSGIADRQKANGYMRTHLAQNTYKPGGSREEALAIFRPDDQHERSEFECWATWQDRYKLARDSGKSDAEAREIAHQAA